ncbi:hypothetical protein BJX68DRAFT_266172 [Aspergillus pseudodeflectus]|uniref:Carrier domain-containing protein n=1 Tax=Aspergillus pseudodeflectus TaxID=176178 RepID=A0ABR4KHJ0_9EURO
MESKPAAAATQNGFSVLPGDTVAVDIESDPSTRARSSSSCSTTDRNTLGSIDQGPSSQSSDSGDTGLLAEVAELCQCSPDDVEDVYACTPLQEGMMALTLRDSTAYTVDYEYTLPRATDPKRLHAAWEETAQANPILRTRIVSTAGHGCMQAVIRGPIPWTEAATDDDEGPGFTANPSWKAGLPLAYFTFLSSRRVLKILIHHSVCDDWSVALLLREADKAYRSPGTLSKHPFRPLVDYVQRTRAQATKFWKDKFRDAETTSMSAYPPLPSRGYNPHPGHCRERTWEINSKLSGAFTINTKLRLAWAVLQAFYVDSPNVLFGAINVGRGVPVNGIEELCGPALTSVPVLARLRMQDTVTEALMSMQRDWASDMPYEHVGLQNLMHLGSGPKAACGFQTLLAVEPRGAHHIPQLFAQHRAVQRNYDLYGLILRCRPSQTQMRVEAWFDPAVVEPRQMERILGQLAHIYGQIERLPSIALADVDPTSPEDREELLRFNAPVAPSASTRSCVHTLIQERATAQGEAPAIHSWDGDLSYKMLDEMTSVLAAHLSRESIRSGSFVPLLLPKSKWTPIAMLAVMKAGGAFVLLDPSFPVSRLRQMCEAVQAPFVITCKELANKTAELGTASFLVDDFDFETALDQTQSVSLPDISPVASLYATFTSGSTGTPKGVLVRHEGYVASATAHGPPYGFGPTARVLQFASPAFDSCIIEHLSTLIMGGCVCIPTQTECHSRLAATICEYQVNVACLTPSVARIIPPDSVPGLHTLALVGETVQASDVERWASQVRLCNAYGPAECSAVFSVQPHLVQKDPANIGYPTGGVGWVVDAADPERLMPLGGTGELLIEGPIVGSGYIADNEQTARVFVDAPRWRKRFGVVQDVPFYKSGDLVQCTGDGSFRYLGRKDTQVKLHGQRLELAEIENHLHRCFPEAKQVVVDMLRSDSSSTAGKNRPDAVLVGFIARDSAAAQKGVRGQGSIFQAASDDFRSACERAETCLREALPSFMVPAVLLPVVRMPLSPSGKLDRRFLRDQASLLSWKQMQAYRTATIPQAQQPVTAQEERLREIWAKTLNRPLQEVGVTDSFFRLGGDSITAMQAATACQAAGWPVMVADIFRCPSIRKLSQRIQELGTKAPFLVQSGEDATDTPFELSPVQQLFFQHVPEGHKRFTQQFLLRLNRPVSTNKIRKATEALVNRHSMLRARFRRQDNGAWEQRITPDARESVLFREHWIPTGDDSQSVLKQILYDSQGQLDIERGPLLVVDLMHEETGQELLGFIAHHLVVDLVSWRVMLKDFEDLLTSGRALQAPSLSFQQWCRMQQEYALKRIDPQTCLPTPVRTAPDDYWGPEIANNTWGQAIAQTICLTPETTQAILGPANDAFNTNVVEILQAALLHSFVRMFPDRACPTLWSEGHGREPWDPQIDISQTVGWFTTMAPLSIDACSGQDITEVMRQTKDRRRAIPGNGWPYFVARYCHPDGRKHSARHTPMEILFNYTGQFQQLERSGALLQLATAPDHDLVPMPPDMPRFALMDISATAIGGSLNVTFMYNSKIRHQARLAEWPGVFRKTLEGLPSALSQSQRLTISDLPLLALETDQQLHDVLQETARKCQIAQKDIESIYPCAPIQLGMWLSHLKLADMYWSQIRWAVLPSHERSVPVDVERVRSAWQQVVDRHPILRTTFLNGVGGCRDPLQVVLSTVVADVRVVTKAAKTTDLDGEAKHYLGDPTKPAHQLQLYPHPDGSVSCLLSIHHTLMDGATSRIILADFQDAYNGVLDDTRGTPYESYVEYVLGNSLEKSNRYWMEYLTGVHACILPSFAAANQSQQAAGLGSAAFNLGPADNLLAFCHQQGLTISSVLRIAWGLVLRSYTGLDSVCFGYLASGRDIPLRGASTIAGPLINLLICRISLSGDLPILSLLEDNQADYGRSIEHQHWSAAEVMHSLGLSGQPLFNTAMSLQQTDTGPLGDGDSTATVVAEGGHDATEYTAAVNITIDKGTIHGNLTYWTQALGDEQAELITDTFQQCVLQLVNTQHRLLKDLQILGPKNKSRLRMWNGNAPDPVRLCIHSSIRERSVSHPKAAAVSAWDGQLTYGELDQIASSWALRLYEHGVRTETFVPICGGKSKWIVVAVLAVLKAGGAFILLDSSLPAERLREMVQQNFQCPFILAPVEYKALAAHIVPRTILIEDLQHGLRIGTPIDGVRGRASSPSSAAYAIFTSGTTGRPKASIIEHESFCSSAAAHIRALHITKRSRVLQFASFAFDVCILEILSTLLAGGCVCVPGQDGRERTLARAIQRHKVNWAILTPSVARILTPRELPTLKTLVLTGEAMRAEDVRRWESHVELMNAYGPSECSVIATAQPSSEVLLSQAANIGKGTGCVTWVADPSDPRTAVPIGAPGELLLEGPIIGRGYVNHSETQKLSFMPYLSWMRTIRDSASGGLYRTGDLVRYLPDGSLQYIGRRDRQVKLHGQRIELAEVEQHVMRCFPRGCHELFATLVALNGTESPYLVVCVVEEDHSTHKSSFNAAVEEAQRRLKTEVPTVMIPAAIVPLRHVPRLVNGKVNHDLISKEAARALKSQLEQAQEPREIWRPEDLTQGERLLQALWAQVLDCPLEAVGPSDNFFQLGGDSIAAMKLAAAAYSSGLDLTVSMIFMHPQLQDLARILSASSANENDEVADALPPLSLIPNEHQTEAREQAVLQCSVDDGDIEDIIPCTALQSGLAVLTAERPGSYVAHHRLRLSNKVDLDGLQAAWEQVSITHPILRTRIIETVGLGCLQVVVRNQGLSWTAPDQEGTEQISQGVPFGKSLVHMKLLRTSREGSSEVDLMLTMHHAVYDAWSLPLLLLEVERAYRNGHGSCAPAVRYQHFVQYALSQKDAALDYWRGQLEDVDAEPFPALPAPSYRPRALQVKRCSLDIKPFDASVTRSTAIRLAWSLVQAQYQGKQDVIFGMVSTGRTAPVKGIESIAAPTIATIPLRVMIDASMTVSQALGNLQRQITQMVPFEQVGLPAIAALAPDASRACGFQTLLNIEGRGEVERIVAELEMMQPVDTVFADGAFNTYALNLTASLKPGSVAIEAAFDEAVIPDWQMQRILDQFSFMLEQVSTRPHATLQEAMAINPIDMQQVKAWNARIRPLVPATVADVVNQHCTSQALSPAVCAWDGDLTYQDLDCGSSAIAGILESHGIGPEMFVPIYMDRSRWVVVAALAVLKVGAAFVLLDTSYPSGRLRTICDEIQAPCILTSESRQQDARTLIDQVVVVGNKHLAPSPDSTHRRHSLATNPHQALYAVFTSGSTGKPKGAVVENGAFVTMAAPWTHTMKVDSHSRVLHLASYAFDVSILEILGTLFAGACICIPSESGRRECVAEAVQTLQPSHSILTPSLLRAMTPGDLGPASTVMLIGEPLRASDVAQWADHVRLINAYGPAECTVVYTMQASVHIPSRASNIGHSIAGAAWIADPSDPNRPVPIGAVGELLLQGPLVGRGYLNNPEQTAAAFIDCPSWLAPSYSDNHQCISKVYRTGDLVRYDSDGSLYFVGRRDSQVKLRGQRFELGEVEDQVQRAFGGTLSDVVALIVAPATAQQAPYLVVFVVPPHPESAPEASTLLMPRLPVIEPASFASKTYKAQGILEDTLPSYMLPRAIIPLRQMPRTIGGKLDRRQLQEAAAGLTPRGLSSFMLTGTKMRIASTEAERTLQRIWSRALGLPPSEVGVDDSFFRLGGDSISALQATTQARAVGIQHSVSDLFRWRTIVQVARRFARDHQQGAGHSSNVEKILACTPAQRGILLSQVRDRTSYTPHFLWKIQQEAGPVNLDLLVSAWHQVVARHAALRTAFQADLSNDGQFEQVCFRQVKPRVNLIQNVPAAAHEDGTPTVLKRISSTVSQLDGETTPHQLTVCTTDTGDVYVRLDISHVIIDAMSMAILETDLRQAYDSSLPVGTQSDAYENYVTFAQNQTSDSAYSYWQAYLEDVEPCRLPVERRPTDTGLVDTLTQLDVSLSSSGLDIESFCRGTDWTASTLLYFAWALTLRAFTRSDDVCFGTLTSGRLVPVDGIDGAIGQFSNMSVCRVRMGREMEVDEVALRLQEDYSNVLAYQAFPLVEIARAAGIPMDELTSTAINVQYEPASTLEEKHSLSLIPISGMDPISQDITVYILLEQTGCIRATMSYRPSTVSSTFATQLSEYFDLAVSSLIQGPSTVIRDLELLTPRDRDGWTYLNPTLPSHPDATVHDLIRIRAQEFPDHLAVSGLDGIFTYTELDQLATRGAALLRARGVSNGQCVPLCFEKSRWLLVAILSVLKVGGTIVPLDPAQPVSRLKEICNRVKATMTISSPCQVSICRMLTDEVLELGDATFAQHHGDIDHATTAAPHAVASSQPVYILFTSGTTGTPKGVMVSHSSYCYAAEHHIRAFGLDHTSRVLQISSYSFDVSMMEILTTLIAGATVCTITDGERSDMLMNGACPFAVSHAYLTPSLAGTLDPSKADWINTLVLQGEPMTASHITAWADKCRLINAYGPTECAVINTATGSLAHGDDPRCIGRGLGTHCWVVDPDDHNILLPLGAVGELVLGGPAVGQGYLDEPQKTNEAFIKPPTWLRALNLGGGSHERLYKTGDLVRCDPETGNLIFEGRKDQQIKVHGQRIEVADVEHHTRRCFDGAKEVVVEQVFLPRTAQSTDPSLAIPSMIPRLVACVMGGFAHETMSGLNGHGSRSSSSVLLPPSSEFQSATAIALRELRQLLPGYMVPDLILPVSRIPLSSSGKTDRSRLREHIRAVPAADWPLYFSAQQSKRPVEGEAEHTFQEILSAVLEIPGETISVDDSFYHLGGDSIVAIKVAARARAAGFTISSHDILRHPTIAEWASMAGSTQDKSGPAKIYEPFSLITKEERQLVLASHLDREHPFTADNVADILPALDFQSFYITNSSLVSTAEVFSAPLDIRRLYQACAKVMSHYSILRTIFVGTGERILQVILRNVDPAFHFVQRDDPQSYIAHRSKDTIAATTEQGELLVSFTIVTSRTRPDWGFIVRLSHAQYDGSSLPFLWQAIAAAYEGKELPPTTQFREVVYNRLGEDHPESVSFWNDYLQKASEKSTDPLGTTCMPGSPQSDATPLTVRREIEHNCRLPDITPSTLVKASVAWVLSRHATLSEIILGQVVHGRGGGALPGMETVLGPCINFLPVRISLGQQSTVADLLHHVQDQQLATVPHDHLPLKQIVGKCTSWPADTRLGCIVHHQAAQPSNAESIAIGGVESTSSTSWANSTPVPGQVGIISIERGSSLDLYMTFPTEGVAETVAEELADAIAHTIRLFSMFPDYALDILTQGGVSFSQPAGTSGLQPLSGRFPN